MRKVYPFKTRRVFSGEETSNVENIWTVVSESVAKCSNEASYYLVANEWIAGCIGQFLRLPIPPFSLVKRRGSELLFASHHVGGETVPPDVNPQRLYAEDPNLCAGIVAFDIFIANRDRHIGNIKVDRPERPKRVSVIDHDRALFYIYPGEGIRELRSRVDRLGISEGDGSGAAHCLLAQIDDSNLLSCWLDRITEIPDWFIDEICKEAGEVRAISKAETTAVVEFLKDRRDRIHKLIAQNAERFTGVTKQWQKRMF